jgi:hypothetical protein
VFLYRLDDWRRLLLQLNAKTLFMMVAEWRGAELMNGLLRVGTVTSDHPGPGAGWR